MRIIDKINMDQRELIKNGPITIVAFGDSITHGCLGANEIDYDTVYWNRLRQKINKVRSYVPVNVINAGIGGMVAKDSITRMERDVFSHNPDLVIVCFGLNDVNLPLDEYLSALTTIFDRCAEKDAQAVFMTPNMLNTHVGDKTPERYLKYAEITAEIQNSGKMDTYMSAACKLAKDKGVLVCDCYSKWKELAKTTDITELLANGINHPTREMHELFAQSLFDVIFSDAPEILNTLGKDMFE